MEFKPKIDKQFLLFIGSCMLVIGIATWWPLFLEGGTDWTVILTLTVVFLVSVGVIAWCSFAIRYVFHPDYLLIKGGPFRSKISYKTITTVNTTRDIYTGYRLLSSVDALELFYAHALLGSVKVSPQNKDAFIQELLARNPNIKVLVTNK
ncbi:PH domain-containing protein [Sporosarcina aquimarina]|uniref:PH domain-containing protein n=1 Tax=Sporosarcina aquimarina TaxID=114975 RepID=UPI00203D4A77|nr:PH domain-containing protein [Sporosarcina aquimarina]MCM3758537.1 PH domain-containing protein [Sporosarcina aquimarina]